MIVGAGDKYARLAYSEGFYKLKVLLRGANPCRYLGEFVAQSHAFLKRAPVLFRVDEELRLADYTLLTAETMQHFVQVDDLLHRERIHSLLTVTERGVGYADLLRHIHRHEAVVERDLRYGVVVEKRAVEVRVGSLLQGVFVRGLLDKVGGFGVAYAHIVLVH